jgi:hypothetical protein
VASYLTIGEIATLFGLPAWKVRRAVDALGVEIQRAGLYRIVPRTLLGKIAAEIERRGWEARSDSGEATPSMEVANR